MRLKFAELQHNYFKMYVNCIDKLVCLFFLIQIKNLREFNKMYKKFVICGQFATIKIIRVTNYAKKNETI